MFLYRGALFLFCCIRFIFIPIWLSSMLNITYENSCNCFKYSLCFLRLSAFSPYSCLISKYNLSLSSLNSFIYSLYSPGAPPPILFPNSSLISTFSSSLKCEALLSINTEYICYTKSSNCWNSFLSLIMLSYFWARSLNTYACYSN